MKTHIIKQSRAKKLEGVEFKLNFELHSNCESCGNLTEEECDNFGDEIVNNNITPKKWEILCNILSDNWADSTGGSVRIYHCNSYEEAKILNDKYHKNLNYNITKWGEFSYILIKWFGDIS